MKPVFFDVMNAIIANFRQSRHTQYPSKPILIVDGVESKTDAQKLVGKKVKFLCPGKNQKTITGEIVAAHGNNGAVRCVMERGLPGQAVGQEISLE